MWIAAAFMVASLAAAALAQSQRGGPLPEPLPLFPPGNWWNADTFPLDSNSRRPDGWTSADAAGLAILPGLIRYDEVFGAVP